MATSCRLSCEDVGKGAAEMGIMQEHEEKHEGKAEGLEDESSANHIEAKRGMSE